MPSSEIILSTFLIFRDFDLYRTTSVVIARLSALNRIETIQQRVLKLIRIGILFFFFFFFL